MKQMRNTLSKTNLLHPKGISYSNNYPPCPIKQSNITPVIIAFQPIEIYDDDVFYDGFTILIETSVDPDQMASAI